MAESFSADWLALREPVDHRSRPAGILRHVEAWWRHRPRPLRVVDLGSGTGSNLRYLAPRFAAAQRWTVVDHDARLLDRVAPVPGAIEVTRVVGDLDREGLAAVKDADLVTASALLDLVSEAWLHKLVVVCGAVGCGALFALSYDGTIAWGDADPDDALVLDAIDAHQRRDKGLGGAALGPAAAPTAAALFASEGFRTWLERSPWVLGPDDRALAHELLRGWEGAAIEQIPDHERRIRAWAERRRAAIARGVALTVGHWDLAAAPADSTAG